MTRLESADKYILSALLPLISSASQFDQSNGRRNKRLRHQRRHGRFRDTLQEYWGLVDRLG